MIAPAHARKAAAASALAQAGFTLIEALVAMAVLAILLSIGVPRMGDWLSAARAGSAAGLYAEGYAMARTQALANNSQSRLLFIPVAGGQPDWQVDICFRTTDTPCIGDDDWSTTGAAAPGAPGAAASFRSVRRSAAGLPAPTILNVAVGPAAAASGVYFTPLGWVDTSRNPRATRVDLRPSTARPGAFRAQAVVLTLAGVAVVCDPDPAIVQGDSRWCPQ